MLFVLLGGENNMRFKITEKDIHPHLRARMDQRSVTTEEIIQAMNSGELVSGARPGTFGKRLGREIVSGKRSYGIL